ncbi:MAG: hypothetical protein AABX90_01850, partial [Nanoarchaeota archaeon]
MKPTILFVIILLVFSLLIGGCGYGNISKEEAQEIARISALSIWDEPQSAIPEGGYLKDGSWHIPVKMIYRDAIITAVITINAKTKASLVLETFKAP